MSNAAVIKNWSFWRKIGAIRRRRKASLIALFAILGGCSAASFNASNQTWKIYSNSRFNFEFPYPSNWISLPPPDNGDGITFVSPTNKAVEIRGWAGNQLLEAAIKDKNAKTSINPNFTTVQGLFGVLTVEVGQQEGIMTLQLTQGKLNYYWQGKAPSQEFDEYYRFFDYIAQNYRISQ